MPLRERSSFVHSADEDEVVRAAARRAEDAGDFAGARRLVRGLSDPEPGDRRWEAQLAAIESRPSPPALARWLVHPALRWALGQPSGAVLIDYADLVLKTSGMRAHGRAEQAYHVAVTDPVVMDAGLFDGGLFDRYLAHLASPLHPNSPVERAGSALLQRTGPVGEWSSRPASIWELRDAASDRILLHDLWAKREVTALAEPTGAPLRTADLLYGRLVPGPGHLPLMFALPPVAVDQRCALRVLRGRRRGAEPAERLRAVSRSRARETSDAEAAA